MLTIKDLSASKKLDSAAMTSVRGGTTMWAEGESVRPYGGIFNFPTIDAGVHTLAQGQAATISQAGNVGGFNAVGNYQTQNGVSGQVSWW